MPDNVRGSDGISVNIRLRSGCPILRTSIPFLRAISKSSHRRCKVRHQLCTWELVLRRHDHYSSSTVTQCHRRMNHPQHQSYQSSSSSFSIIHLRNNNIQPQPQLGRSASRRNINKSTMNNNKSSSSSSSSKNCEPNYYKQQQQHQQRRRGRIGGTATAAIGAGMVYAVANGPRPGIYYWWKEEMHHHGSRSTTGSSSAEAAIRGVDHAQFESFSGVAAAQRYLAEQAPHLLPPATNGWVSTKSRSPILYQYNPQQLPVHPQETTTTTTTTTREPSTTQKRTALEATSSSFSPSCSTDDPASFKRPRTATATAVVPQHPKQQAPCRSHHPLDPCQQRAVDAAMDGQNVFLTGVAGTGKSLVTKLIYEQALARFGSAGTTTSTSTNTANRMKTKTKSLTTKKNRKVALCAPTGMAAVGLGPNGQTLHTLAGIQVPARASDFSSMHRGGGGGRPGGSGGGGAAGRWQELECLIIDEVGMLAADFLDWLDWNVRRIRNCLLEPFGGIQLIFVGDFCQLGPVPGSLSLRTTTSGAAAAAAAAAGGGKRLAGPPYPPHHSAADAFLNIRETTAFAFQSVLWREADFSHVHLTHVYRQTDRAFVQALQDLRAQRPDTDHVRNLVAKCATPLEDRETRHQLFFGGDTSTTNDYQHGDDDEEAASKVERTMTIPPGLLPTILYTNNKNADRENAERLASLTTEHKRFVAQDSVHVDDEVAASSDDNTAPQPSSSYIEKNLRHNKFFDQCQATHDLDLKIGAQVMLVQNLSTEDELVNGSRGVVEKFVLVPVLRDFQGTEERLLGPDDTDLFPEGKTYEQLDFHTVFHFQDKTWKMCRKVKYPLVRFLNHRTKIILPTTFERTLFRQGTCRRVQLPLRLSWALTIHKAQGCTLDWLICDLAGCFTAGQAYVALSRAKSMAGLQIRNFSPHAVVTHPLVDAFYHALAKDTVSDFLYDQAGLWWYPLLPPTDEDDTSSKNTNKNNNNIVNAWYRMFSEASGTAQAKVNAAQFRQWVANYPRPQSWSPCTATRKMTPNRSSINKQNSNNKKVFGPPTPAHQPPFRPSFLTPPSSSTTIMTQPTSSAAATNTYSFGRRTVTPTPLHNTSAGAAPSGHPYYSAPSFVSARKK